jgi:hypothetical protein
MTTLHAQQPSHCRQRPRIGERAVVLVGADVAVLAEGAAHIAGGEGDRARAVEAAIDELLAGVVEMRTHPRRRAEFAGAQLGSLASIDAAVPAAEIAVPEHPPGEFPAKVEQARARRPRRQARARVSHIAPAGQKRRRQALQLLPQSLFRSILERERNRDRRRDAKLGRLTVGGDRRVPAERPGERRITPHPELSEIGHLTSARETAIVRLSPAPVQRPGCRWKSCAMKAWTMPRDRATRAVQYCSVPASIRRRS